MRIASSSCRFVWIVMTQFIFFPPLASADVNYLTCSLPTDSQPRKAAVQAQPPLGVAFKDSAFGTKNTRVSGDPGKAINPKFGGSSKNPHWGELVQHFSGQTWAWNANMSLIGLFSEETTSGGIKKDLILLDGSSYEPLYVQALPFRGAVDLRWDSIDSSSMIYAHENEVGYWNVRTNSITVLATFDGYKNLHFGSEKGSVSADGAKVVLMAIDASERPVYFTFQTNDAYKYYDNDATSIVEAFLTPSASQLITINTAGLTEVRTLYGSIVQSWSDPARLMYFDLAVDGNGDEVAVGIDSTAGKHGVVMRRIADGQTTSLASSAKTGAASAVSAGTGLSSAWVLVDHGDSSDPAEMQNELALVRTDDGQSFRIAQTHDSAHPKRKHSSASLAPDGLRAVYSSAWDDGAGNPKLHSYVVDVRQECATTAPADVLIVNLSEDEYYTDAEFTIAMDGRVIGSRREVKAKHSDYETTPIALNGNWGPGPHVVTIDFTNFYDGGSADTRRNLYVDSIIYNGQEVSSGGPVSKSGGVDFKF